MTIFLPRSKSDRQNRGRSYPVPALSQLCPVTAYLDWINTAGLSEGPVFRSISRWGKISDSSIHPDSLNAILKTLWKDVGLIDADRYSSHSLRRGFANWANSRQWDLKSLMDYVGWRDTKSALRYLDSAFQDTQIRIQQDLTASLPQKSSASKVNSAIYEREYGRRMHIQDKCFCFYPDSCSE